MKNIKNIILFIIMSIVLVACEDKGLENLDWLQKPNFVKPMTLTPSSENVEMSSGNDNATAIIFTWTKGNDRGAGTTLTYFFLMDIVGNNFGANTVFKEEIPVGIFTKSYTVGELNALLIEKWGYPGGTKAKLEVKIIARVDNSLQFQKPELAFTSFSAKTFSPGPLPLFLVGDAISGGWNYSTGMNITEIIERSQYAYTGNFSVGAFKIIEKSGNELPSYDPNGANTLVYNQTEPRTASNVFNVVTAGRYSLYMNRTKLTYIFAYTPYENVYMLGSATAVGWNIDTPIKMIWSQTNPEEFTYTGPLTPGEMKLPLDLGNWGGRFIMPLVGGTEINGDGTDVTTFKLSPTGWPDDKWVIKTAGNYKITLNQSKMTIVFKKL
ncbi:SusF/SusE family outer membrane protein [Flavobacterium undicola]|uniref:SusF/SusE family outer membrane protein n=1 Tax=Flavobacterium undicola TaxID=1932779 RepID=UPI001377C473|nr:SusF/SusE family outer membrane protein [Flavobacterium undicola]MBA0882447.1 SusF/SusE family outer membrane protein [Flavobacterium undicola]